MSNYRDRIQPFVAGNKCMSFLLVKRISTRISCNFMTLETRKSSPTTLCSSSAGVELTRVK